MQSGQVPEMPRFHGPKDYLDLARSPHATAEQLRELARSPYNFVIEAVAGHPATPADTLASIVPPEPQTGKDNAILLALVRNPNTPVEVLRRVPELVLPQLANRNEHYSFEAAVALAERDDTPDDVLVALVSDPRAFTEFRKVIARQTTHDMLRERLQSDRSEKVRRAALRSTDGTTATGGRDPAVRTDDLTGRSQPAIRVSRVIGPEGLTLDYLSWLEGASVSGLSSTLRAVASFLRDNREVVEIPLVAEPPFAGMTLVVRRLPGSKLRVSIDEPTIVVECDPDTIDPLFINLFDLVAEMADDAAGDGTPRHCHIEYLGEPDTARAPDCIPLVIGEDRPGWIP